MAREYRPFMDWMKCVGIFLIVMGHVAGRPTNFALPPIYPKQLGVAFFIFVMAYSLARETRPRWQVLFNRLFEVYLFGGAIALLLSIVMFATRGTLQLSNYLPFALGVNVVFNNFPANPTMWYIGTYLHVLLLWALGLRHIRVRAWMLVVSFGLEVALRAILIPTAGEYIAYMLLPNWVTVFMVGTLFGQQAEARSTESPANRRAGVAFYALLAVAFGAVWYTITTPYVVDHSFPFMRLSSVGSLGDAAITSVSVSVVYLAWTLLAFQITRRASAWTSVQFFARNTLIIFIAHMPVFYALDSVLRRWTIAYAPRAVVQLLVCFVGLALISEVVTRAIRPKALRDWVGQHLLGGTLAPAVIAPVAAKPR